LIVARINQNFLNIYGLQKPRGLARIFVPNYWSAMFPVCGTGADEDYGSGLYIIPFRRVHSGVCVQRLWGGSCAMPLAIICLLLQADLKQRDISLQANSQTQDIEK